MDKLIQHNQGDGDEKHRLHLSEAGLMHSDRCREIFVSEFMTLNRYPDPSCNELMKAICSRYRLPAEMVFVSNGLDEVIFLLAVLLLKGQTESLVSRGCYPGYELSALANGASVVEVPLEGQRVQPLYFQRYTGPNTKVAFMCNPLNPCGTVVSKEAAIEFAGHMEAAGVVPVVDEAYVDFAGADKYSLLREVERFKSLVVLRSLSKSFGLAALRVGFAVGPPTIIEQLYRVARALPFRVNRVAQRIAVEVLRDNDYVTQNVARCRGLVREAQKSLQEVGIEYVESATNFVFARTGPLGKSFWAALEEEGARVRDCSSFGHPGWSRISMGTNCDLRVLQRVLSNVAPERSTKLA